MKILVVEDEVQLADTLAEILKRNKYNVDTVFDGDDGLEYARTGIYDCILLDIMLPVRSGTEIVQILRQEKNATPIMLLTAKSEVEDKIHGLDCGADDYLTESLPGRKRGSPGWRWQCWSGGRPHSGCRQRRRSGSSSPCRH